MLGLLPTIAPVNLSKVWIRSPGPGPGGPGLGAQETPVGDVAGGRKAANGLVTTRVRAANR